ncbi:MAG: hypothetical protein ACR2PC_02760 [Tsuneonella suprasediminis]
MNARRLLDADMATVGRWLSEGVHWWIAELEQLLPARLRHVQGDRLPRFRFADGQLVRPMDGKAAEGNGPRPGTRIAVTVPCGLCLARVIERPALGERDLQRMAAFEGDSLLPFPSGARLIAARPLGPGAEPKKARVEVAGLPLETARTIADRLVDARAVAVRVILEDEGELGRPIDFAPAMREAGLIARPRSATPFIWGVVGCLALTNVAALILRDIAAVERLEATVGEQQPAVTSAQTIIRRIAGDRALIARSLARRQSHDALAGLAITSGALPEGSWLQRYVWDGATVTLTGYKPPSTDVGSALRRSGAFAEVRSTNDEIQAEVPAGKPFDISARIVKR